jgi:hypothetical protein
MFFYKNILKFFKQKVSQIHHPSINQQIQKLIFTQYVIQKNNNIKIFDNISEAGFRCYSQFEEDGIILYLLSMIGIHNKTVVEICCGTGTECMATNLIINHGFKGYLFEGKQSNISLAADFFNSQKDCLLIKPKLTCAWITKDNINKLLIESGVTGEIDVLALDIDGNDYHIWDSISAINPRICIFETQNIIPFNLSLTMPYVENFFLKNTVPEKYFFSASLAAMNKLSNSKGYTLVGSHRHGFNVFYVRNDLLKDFLPKPNLQSIHDNEYTKYVQSERWPLVKNFPWMEV